MKIILKDLIALEGELYGLIANYNDGTPSKEIFKGMLAQPIGIKAKYHLNKLAEEVKKEKSLYDNLYNEMLKRYGRPTEDGGFEFDSESREKLISEQEVLFSQEVEIKSDISKVTIEDFADLKTEYNYPVLFGIIGE